ncbi:MAG: DinB family protein, partial [Planctomycetota bacterium]
GSELLDLAKKQRSAILEKVATLSEGDLDAESPESMRSYAPNAGAVLNMLGTHWVMHAGQWVIVRRMLEKDIVI